MFTRSILLRSGCFAGKIGQGKFEITQKSSYLPSIEKKINTFFTRKLNAALNVDLLKISLLKELCFGNKLR